VAGAVVPDHGTLLPSDVVAEASLELVEEPVALVV